MKLNNVVKTLDKKSSPMLIKNYRVDNKDFSYSENIKCHNFSLDLRLICISDDLIRDLETLKKYHISNRVLDASSKNFSRRTTQIFFQWLKIIDGHNPNEVILLKKQTKIVFEKFFNFFS